MPTCGRSAAAGITLVPMTVGMVLTLVPSFALVDKVGEGRRFAEVERVRTAIG